MMIYTILNTLWMFVATQVAMNCHTVRDQFAKTLFVFNSILLLGFWAIGGDPASWQRSTSALMVILFSTFFVVNNPVY